MASSTTKPIANTIANNVSVLIEKSRITNAANVPISDTGTASSGINVARQLCRKIKITNTTSSNASINVCATSSIEARIKSVLSKISLIKSPGGKFGR